MTFCHLFQSVEPSTSRPSLVPVTALEKILAYRYKKTKKVLIERNELLSSADLKIKRLQERLLLYSKRVEYVEGRLRLYHTLQEARDKEVAAAQEKTMLVEEALRAKTLELQELQGLLSKSDKPPQGSTCEVPKLAAEVKNIEGRPEPQMTSEMKTYNMIKDVQDAEEVYGAGSEQCKLKQKKLDKWLQELVDAAKQEAEADDAKAKAKRTAEFRKNVKGKGKSVP